MAASVSGSPLVANISGEIMGKMKTLLLDAVIALEKVIEAGGTVETVLEFMDHVDDYSSNASERETR